MNLTLAMTGFSYLNKLKEQDSRRMFKNTKGHLCFINKFGRLRLHRNLKGLFSNQY